MVDELQYAALDQSMPLCVCLLVWFYFIFLSATALFHEILSSTLEKKPVKVIIHNGIGDKIIYIPWDVVFRDVCPLQK